MGAKLPNLWENFVGSSSSPTNQYGGDVGDGTYDLSS